MRRLMRQQSMAPDDGPVTISTEYIPWPDYGGGAKYSVFEQNIACAEWLRRAWADTQALPPS
jgi:hypothetical protein